MRALVFVLGVVVFFNSCVEPFEPSTLTFEPLLVVEAVITDEEIRQTVLLSRITPLEDNTTAPESNAVVEVLDNQGNTIVFMEESPGEYLSAQPFAAMEGTTYSLTITTSNGDIFASETASMSGIGTIERVEAVRTVNDNGVEGVQISANGVGLTQNASSFRYEFEETYQIVSPFAPSIDLILVSENPLQLERRLKEKEELVCFRTQTSNTFGLINTSVSSGNTVVNFPIKFIPIDDFSIRSRYSINVKQFVQTRETQAFYEALSDFSDVENLFVQTQPGLITGNIFPVNNPENRVVGLFEVSSVSTQRIFFNFDDIFPNGTRPRFINECEDMEFLPNDPNFIGLFRTGRFKYVGEDALSGAIFIALDICVDCTLLGSNVVPDFWEE